MYLNSVGTDSWDYHLGCTGRWYVPVKIWGNVWGCAKCIWYSKWCFSFMVRCWYKRSWQSPEASSKKINIISVAPRYHSLQKWYPKKEYNPAQRSLHVLTEMVLNDKTELQSFVGIMNYLARFSLSTTEVCEPLQKLTSSNYKWTWNSTYQNLYDKANNIIKKNETMAFYNEKQQLYLETNASDVRLGASLLQAWDWMWFPRDEASDSRHCCQ